MLFLITAAKDVTSLTEALHSGVFDYILKPLVFDRLQSALHNYREHSEKLHAIEQQSMQGLDQTTVDQLLPRNKNLTEKDRQREPAKRYRPVNIRKNP